MAARHRSTGDDDLEEVQGPVRERQAEERYSRRGERGTVLGWVLEPSLPSPHAMTVVSGDPYGIRRRRRRSAHGVSPIQRSETVEAVGSGVVSKVW